MQNTNAKTIILNDWCERNWRNRAICLNTLSKWSKKRETEQKRSCCAGSQRQISILKIECATQLNRCRRQKTRRRGWEKGPYTTWYHSFEIQRAQVNWCDGIERMTKIAQKHTNENTNENKSKEEAIANGERKVIRKREHKGRYSKAKCDQLEIEREEERAWARAWRTVEEKDAEE